MTRGRRRRSPAPASPTEDDDLLSEILLRLPPAPSSLPRASLVCKQWCRLVSDPGFLRRFRARHRRNPPLLGLLKEGRREISFTPTLEPPDRIPSRRFSLKLDDGCRILGCRHGLVLILNRIRLQVLVWDPVTSDLSRVAFPPGFLDTMHFNGAVLSPAVDVNGCGHSSHFQVVLVSTDQLSLTFACVYSSDTGTWGNLISAACPSMFLVLTSTLVGGSLYWLLVGEDSVGILEFDLDRQRLAVIEMPLEISDRNGRFRVMRAAGGGLGVLHQSSSMIHLWKRKTDGDAGWVLENSIELDKLLSLSTKERFPIVISIPALVEDDNVLFLRTRARVVMIQLDSMKLKKYFGTFCNASYHPFSCVYTAGMGTSGEKDGAELLQSTNMIL